MDRMLYLAMSGAKQTLLAQSVHAHNLANGSTVGYRADLAQFRSQPVFGPGLPSRVYAMTERPAVDQGPGTVLTTGRELDMAIAGEGWLAVQAPDGSEAYTRAGDLRLGSNGILETGAGHPVLGNAGPIAVPPADKLEIGADGTVTIRPLGQEANALAIVDRIKLVRIPVAELHKGGDGLFRRQDGVPAEPDASVTLVPGSLESSNVNAVEAMVQMIALARQFEMQIQMMQKAEENDAAATRMLQLTQ
jgi:flagellar basal-body rod protein FlgF